MTPQSAPPSSPRPRLRLVLLGLGLVLALILASGAVTLLGGGQGAAAAPATVTGRYDISVLGEELQLDGAAPWSVQTPQGDRLLRVTGPGQDAVLALAQGSDAVLPRWIAPIPADAPACMLDAEALHCGSTRIDPASGVVLEARATGIDSSGSPDATTSDGGGDEGSAALASDGGAADTSDGGGVDGSASAGITGPGVLMGGEPGEAPLSVSADGTLRDEDGDPVDGPTLRPGAPVWALGVEVPRHILVDLPLRTQVTVVSDGALLLGVQGGQVLWKHELDAASAALTGLGQPEAPSWRAVDGVVLIARGDAVVAIDARTGAERWSLRGPVDDWGISGSRIHVLTQGTLVVADLAVPSEEPHAALLPADGSWEEQRPAPLEAETFAEAELDLPAHCAEFALDFEAYTDEIPPSGTVTAQFTDSVARPVDGLHPSSVTITAVHATVVDGAPAALVTLDCFGGGSYSYDALALYDGNLELIAALDTIDPAAPWVDGMIYETSLEDLTVTGSTVSVAIPGLELPGDGSCHGCEKSGSVQATFSFAGGEVAMVDAVYETPVGAVRTPQIEEAQEVVDLIATGDDDAARERFTESAPYPQFAEPGEDQSLVEVPLPERSWMFPRDITVEHCELMGGYDAGLGYTAIYLRNGMSIPDVYVGPDYSDIAPGDTICGLTSASAAWSTNAAPDTYGMYMIIAGDPEGEVRLREIGYASIGD